MKKPFHILKGISSDNIFFYEVQLIAFGIFLVPLRDIFNITHGSKYPVSVTMPNSFNEELTFNLHEQPEINSSEYHKILVSTAIASIYEKIKLYRLSNKEPLLEFTRHIRNASSHNKIFTFNKFEPSNVAEWRGLKITKDLDGTNLFDFIEVTDIALLIFEVIAYLFENRELEIVKGYRAKELDIT